MLWRNGQNSNFPPLISQRFYQITSQTRWHLVATDKTFLQLKGFDKIPTDKREIEVKALNIHAIIIMAPKHDKKFPNISNIRKWHLNDPAPLLITIKVDNL